MTFANMKLAGKKVFLSSKSWLICSHTGGIKNGVSINFDDYVFHAHAEPCMQWYHHPQTPPLQNNSNTRPPRRHRPPQLPLLLRLLPPRQSPPLPNPLQKIPSIHIPHLINLLKLSKIQRPIRINRRPHIKTPGHRFRPLKRIHTTHVREPRLDFRQSWGVGERGEGVPAVEQGPGAGEGVAELLGEVVVEGADVDGEDGVGAEGFHVRDRQIVDVAAVQQHAAFVAERGDEAGQGHGGADIAPHVPGIMELGAGFGDVGGVAVEIEPEVLHLGVAEGLEDAAVEFVPGGVGGGGVGEVEGEAPHGAHAAGEAFDAAVHGDDVGVAGVEGADEGADGGPAHDVDGDAGFFEGADHADLGYASGATASKDETDGFAAETSR